MEAKRGGTWSKIMWTILTILVGIGAIIIYFRYEHDASHFIRSLGPLGILAAILLMAVLCIIPFPAEFLMVVDMQIFGVWAGILYVWLGAMLGSYATYAMAKRFGERLVAHFVKPSQLHKLTSQFAQGGAINILLARLIPFIPFVVFNYACGLLPEIRLWTYLWTTGLGIMPYDLGAALLFLGFSSRVIVWIVVGCVALAIIWAVTLWFRRRSKPKVSFEKTAEDTVATEIPKSRRQRTPV